MKEKAFRISNRKMKLIAVDNSEEHYNICRRWFEDDNISKWLSSVLRFSKYYKLIHDMLVTNRKNRVFFVVTEENFLGLVGLSNVDVQDKRGEVWYLVGSEADWGKDIATEAVGLIKDMAVKDMGIHTLYAFVAESNNASARVLEKNGFEYVGRFREAFKLENAYRDFLIYDCVAGS